MNPAPLGWKAVSISEVAQVVGGGTPPSKDQKCFAAPGQGISWVTPADLSGYKLQEISRGSRDLTPAGLAACSAKLLPAGAVLFSSRAPIGYVAIASGPVATNQGFKSFVFPEDIDSRFAYYQLKHIKPVAEALATGTTFKELSGSAAAKLPFLLAPGREQKRIADKLDTILTRVDAVNTRLTRVPHLLKRFRQSVLAAATSGRLTEDWRDGRALNWDQPLFADVVVESSTGLVRSASEQFSLQEGLVPYLKMNSVGEMWGYECIDLPGVNCSTEEFKRYELRQGDWLFNTRNSVELVGKSCVWNGPSGVVFNNNLLRIRFQAGINPMWVEIFFRSPKGRDLLATVKSATTSVAAIYQGSLMGLAMLLPPEDEQTEIVCRVEALFAFVERLEARLQTAQTATERMTPALLAKAFRGELVPQDSNDEPASELLRKLQQKVPSTETKRGRKSAA
jgi:type I restriction enzyme S subunit